MKATIYIEDGDEIGIFNPKTKIGKVIISKDGKIKYKYEFKR